MSPRARRLTATIGAFVAACVVMLSAFAGSAAARPYPTMPDRIMSIKLTKNSADMKRIAEYWTPARLKEVQNNTPAIPESKPSGSATATATPTATPSVSPTPSASPVATAKATPRPKTVASSPIIRPTLPKKSLPTTGNSPITVGKVFFRMGDKDYWCSASSVASANHNLVATAAHCAYDARQGRAANYWIFIPGYSQGKTPYGIYVGHSLNLHEDFPGMGDYDFDYAFVTVHDGFRWKPGKAPDTYEMEDVGSLEDNVGGQGLVINRHAGMYVFAFGYPAAPHIDGSRPYDGQKVLWCDGRTKRQNAPARLVELGIALQCGFTAGASGGPWLVGYNPSTGLGYLNGVNSLAWDTDVDRKYDQISSPYFTRWTYAVYQWAEKQRPA
ncbi:trypsin-like serine peptidase [Streptosporangium sp. NPDC000396]|uniref:trypsin-like serine peptidase n=1 Tax=Streptosporangium sp. NPDC000396 TaxID=3366185 RepID=UPI003675A814